jgi:two-component system, cell cycle response regulator
MSARVLVVDDVDVNVRLLEAKLSSEYFTVVTASSGEEALRMARSEHPDIILLDVMMPEMDGFEVCRRLKADPATDGIPVVMVTALSEVADRVRGLQSGADDFLTKPVNDVALFARVRSLVRLKRMTEEWRLREEVYGRFDTVIDDGRRKEDMSPANVVLWEETDFAADRLT